MALIGKIRKNSWLLVVLIALGLGGFIVMDMTSGQQSIFGSNQLILGEIEGRKVDWNEFYRVEQLLYGNAPGDVYGRRTSLWDYYVEESLLQKEAEKIGLGVSKAELLDLEFGPNPSPIIRQIFQNPAQPGSLDREQLNFIKQIIDERRIDEAVQNGQIRPDFRPTWAQYEKRIIKDRIQTKLNNLVTKAFYTPAWMAEMGHVERSLFIDFAFVKVPFDELDNTEVALSDDDYKAFIKENEAFLRQDEETRKVQYVVFNIFPTAEDSAAIRGRIASLAEEFEKTDSDSLFILRNEGVYDTRYFKKTELSPVIADTVFSMPVGSVYGPYEEAGAYRAVKVIDKMIVPDSVRARHILIRAENAMQLLQAQTTADSLKNLIETGRHTFDSLAVAFGTDATAAKGGDLGYAALGQMVRQFNDLIFYRAEQGKIYTIATQFGFHVVEVTGRKFLTNEPSLKVAYISEQIEPSKNTQDEMYQSASSFLLSNQKLDDLVKAASADPELSVETSGPLKRNDFDIPGLEPGQSSRDIIRWAFNSNTSVGDISGEIYSFEDPVNLYNSKYVIAGLKSIRKPGLPTVEDVKDEIEQVVLNRKKAEIIEERIKGKSLEEVASTYGLTIDTSYNAAFVALATQEMGSEPKVIASAFNLEQGQTSEPITGQSGVFVLKVFRKPAVESAGDLALVGRQMSATMRSRLGAETLIGAMRKNADITDNRFRFY